MSKIESEIQSLTVFLVGESGTGKTTYIKNLSKNNYYEHFSAEFGLALYDIFVENKNCQINLTICEVDVYSEFNYFLFQRADYFLIFFDLSGQCPFENFLNARSMVKFLESSLMKKINYIYVANKYDISKKYSNHDKKMIMVSAKDDYNLEKPIKTVVNHFFK